MPPSPAIVFDLDGTLVDTAPDLLYALNRLLRETGRRAVSARRFRRLVGEGARRMIEKGLGGRDEKAAGSEAAALIERFLALYDRHLTRRSAPFPGVPETLKRLRGAGARLGVCTNKPHALAQRLLTELDLLPLVDAVLGADRAPAKKPDAGHVHALLDALGAAARDSVMVGDSGIDVAAARAAGLPVIAVSYGYSLVPAERLGADLVIERFSDLPEALGRLA